MHSVTRLDAGHPVHVSLQHKVFFSYLEVVTRKHLLELTQLLVGDFALPLQLSPGHLMLK